MFVGDTFYQINCMAGIDLDEFLNAAHSSAEEITLSDAVATEVQKPPTMSVVLHHIHILWFGKMDISDNFFSGLLFRKKKPSCYKQIL